MLVLSYCIPVPELFGWPVATADLKILLQESAHLSCVCANQPMAVLSLPFTVLQVKMNNAMINSIH